MLPSTVSHFSLAGMLLALTWLGHSRLAAQEHAQLGATDQAVRALVEEAWDWELQEDPLLATDVSDPRGQDRLPSDRPEDLQRRAMKRREFLQRLQEINPQMLSDSARADFEVLRLRLSDAIREYEFGTYKMPLTSRSGFHVSFPDLPQSMKLEQISDYENYLARLADFSRYTDEQIALMRLGLATGETTPAIVLRDIGEQLESLLVDEPQQSLLFKPFKDRRPPSIAEADWQRLSHRAEREISQHVTPAFRRLADFMQREYLPACRSSIAAHALPQGREFYRFRVQHFTTLDVTPEEVHQIGLSEVARIREEMMACAKRLGFTGTLAEFVVKLRNDKSQYATTPEELMQYVALICKRIDGALPQVFSKLPRTPYGLKEIPAFVAPQTTSAYYWPPAGDGTRAGTYYLNTYNLASRPKYEMEALSAHEAVPGHHLQIALQQELEDLHAIRRFSLFTAFVEGWALYSEWLGLEIGLYQDPYQDFGRLSMEAWRACRLVVDTGMHALGWSREQAIAYMTENTALTEHNIVAEVDRYIGWPGQALGYKMGQLKIRELRTKAETALGNKFDLRKFHEVVLSQGAIPLALLEENVQRWIDGMSNF